MKFKLKIILTMCLVAFGSSGNQNVEPTSVVLSYDNSSISAEIYQDRKFETIKDTDEEHVEFSGSVTKDSSDYIVDVLVVRKSKSRKSSRELNTTILVQNEQIEMPIVIGRVNSEVFSITLK
ncbi:hypothetical protein AL552_17960 [Vibrio diabolicus]|uniref:hypothetical protein n=1 Tax=Vibrio diabolicus TaxID=50719 RepID=UPI000CE98AE4|nr:hypothetical protein [Vibrio diabolicus]AVF95482.1 hypothetical protein AL552_17960 [Vibrio diabolicus]